MRYAELFAGAGGLSLGLDRAGFECAWHSEIADFPRRVLKHHWPDTPLYGDVSQLDGRELVRLHGEIDLLSGGSPCQDLSVAGKRAGLNGARSGLFYEQMRLWDEAGAPLCLWENVDGARSSNDGKDFAAILTAFVGSTVVVPGDGWGSAGVAIGTAGICAWRVLDAQYFGVPQRRRRVFVLGSRAERFDPSEILLEPESLRGNPKAGGAPRERTAASFGAGIEGESRIAGTLQACGAGLSRPGGMASEPDFVVVQSFAQNQRGEVRLSEVDTSLNVGGGKPGEGYPAILTYKWHNQDSRLRESSVAATLNLNAEGREGNLVLAFHPTQDPISGPVSPSLETSSEGMGVLINETGHEAWRVERVAGSLNAHEAKEAHSLILSPTVNGHQRQQVDAPMTVSHGTPRRLMPIECERLMSWPDNWTNIPDEKGKPVSDAARYKSIGNGVASCVVEWIGMRIKKHAEKKAAA